MKLFDSIVFHLSPSLRHETRDLLQHVLLANGAKAAGTLGDATHVITNSNRYEGWEGVGADVAVVTEKWVERSLLLGKLQPPSFYSADPDMIFSGVMATATDLPTQDLEVLSAGILALGGQWRTGLTREITHLFTLSPTGPKYTTALHHQPSTNIAIVLPHWFDDAVRLGLGSLPTKPYEFPDPPVLKNPALQAPASPSAAKAEKEKRAIGETDEVKRSVYETAVRYSYLSTDAGPSSSNSNTVPGTTPGRGAGSSSSPVKGPPSSELQVAPAAGAREVWGGRRILLARNLMLFGGRRDAVAVGIQRAGGVVVRWEGDDEEDEDSVVANTTANATTTPNTTADVSTTNAGNTTTTTTNTNTAATSTARKRSRALLRHRQRLEATAIPSCDIYITRYRSGPAYTSAFRAGKTIGTLAWLYHVQATGVVSRPMDQLLHYPVPERRVEGFGGHVFHSPPSSIIGPDAQQDHRSTARRGRRAYSTDYGQVPTECYNNESDRNDLPIYVSSPLPNV
ncbi:hypothetical protein DFP72DRAFT_1170674 [Ephemerocybe angulata]|uniref:BRCT domain-containing protein n=1 Tax=Ephemerocybe angulata TaxID=980116 RepID=A0A8H6HX33_9AGAR|nr:hypothetical protein DFP72DRAFT_1170674 [Tulosesus angulatus]